MFFVIGLAIYLLPGIYLYFRIKKLFAATRNKIIYTIVYSILFLAFPATEIISHASDSHIDRSFLLPGLLSAPFLLYLLLTVLFMDNLRLLNHLFHVLPADRLQSRPYRTGALCALIAIPSIVVAIGMVRFSNLRVNEYHIRAPRKLSQLRHIRIALASDFHLSETTDARFMERFASTVNELDADLLLMPGDLVEGTRQDGQLDEFERQFRRIHTTYGMYATLGNHDSYGRSIRYDFFRKSNIALLQDSVFSNDSAFALIGRNDSRFERRKPIDALMRSTSGHLPVIVLDHRPTDFKNIAAAGVDILVCGHTHEGQLWPLNYIVQQIYPLSWGYTKMDNTNIFVTSGVQLWGPPVRTAGDAEIMLISVDFIDEGISDTIDF